MSMSQGNNGRLTLTVSEAAQLLGLSVNSAYTACHKGEIPCVRIGSRILIPREKLNRLLGKVEVEH